MPTDWQDVKRSKELRSVQNHAERCHYWEKTSVVGGVGVVTSGERLPASQLSHSFVLDKRKGHTASVLFVLLVSIDYQLRILTFYSCMCKMSEKNDHPAQSFFPRTLREWSHLPPLATTAPSLDAYLLLLGEQ